MTDIELTAKKPTIADVKTQVVKPKHYFRINSLEHNASLDFPSNGIRTSKYTWWNFLPYNLWEQFMRLGNLFFLLVVVIQFIPNVSPFPWWTSVLPLTFILGVSAIKQGVEDYRRHIEDDEANGRQYEYVVPSSVCISGGNKSSLAKTAPFPHMYTPESGDLVRTIDSRDIGVGMIVKLYEGQEIPADIVLISSSNPDGTCYVNTANLDGEPAPKMRFAPDATAHLTSAEQLVLLRGEVRCDAPNPLLEDFQGRLEFAEDDNKEVRLSLSVTAEALLHPSNTSSSSVDDKDMSLAATSLVPDSTKPMRAAFSLNDRQMLLRGSKLINTEHCFGVVCYTGAHTKMMLNRSPITYKFSRFEKTLNRCVIIAFMTHLALVTFATFVFAMGDDAARAHEFVARYALTHADRDVETDDSVFLFLTMYIQFSFVIPMSLYVTVEILRLIQLTFMQWDHHMMHWRKPDTLTKDDVGNWEAMVVKNSQLNEELGNIDFIFSDKTGTLTQNVMALSTISVAGTVYFNHKTQTGEEAAPQVVAAHHRTRTTFSQRELGMDALVRKGFSGDWEGKHKITDKDSSEYYAREYLLALLLNNSVLPVILQDNMEAGKLNKQLSMEFQSQSPDEVAFLTALHNHDLTLFRRSGTRRELKIRNVSSYFEMLAELEFSSSRARMSVVMRKADGTIMLYVKGADATVLPLCGERSETYPVTVHLETDTSTADAKSRDSSVSTPAANSTDVDVTSAGLIRNNTNEHLALFSEAGKRTLVIACRELSQEEWDQWKIVYETAQNSLENRKEETTHAFEQIEHNLTLLGCSGIEDELQEHIHESIDFLLAAEIRLMILTGDKKETAVTIGRHIGLVPSGMNVVYLESTPEQRDTSVILAQVKHDIKNQTKVCLAISGRFLQDALEGGEPDVLFEMINDAVSVICFRCTPAHKAMVVSQFKEKRPEHVYLAIGDGANDVSMIQAAHVGVGIRGREGGHAALSADYAIYRFHHLIRLLAVHGRYANYRTAMVVFLSFYKNFVMPLPMYFFLFFSGVSGQILYSPSFLSLYNMVFLSLAPFGVGVFERDIKWETAMHIPQALAASRLFPRFTLLQFVYWIIVSTWHSAVLFVTWCFIFESSTTHEDGRNDGLWYMGDTMFFVMLILITGQFLASTYRQTIFLWLCCFLGVLAFFGWFLLLSLADFDPIMLGLFPAILATPMTWLYLLFACVCSAIPSFTLYAYKFLFASDFLAELQQIQKELIVPADYTSARLNVTLPHPDEK